MSIWTKTSSGWVEIGGGGGSDGLEGLGDWAVISEVSGSPKRYAYNDGDTDWVAFEWTDTSKTHTLTTQAGGLADILVLGGGGFGGTYGANTFNGSGGHAVSGLHNVNVSNNVVVAATSDAVGDNSELGPYMARGGSRTDARGAFLTSEITGTSDIYGRGNQPSPRANKGEGGRNGINGSSGTIIVRVPAAQAAGVDPGSWVTRIDYYAEVTDGIVTDIYQERFYGDDTVRTENGQYASPEQPDDLIPCDPSVAEGWTYADGEFTPPPPPPPPTRDELIEALQEQIKDLQKDT